MTSNDKEFEEAVIETEELDATHNDELREFIEWLDSDMGRNAVLGEVDHYPERGRVEYVNLTMDVIRSELESMVKNE